MAGVARLGAVSRGVEGTVRRGRQNTGANHEYRRDSFGKHYLRVATMV